MCSCGWRKMYWLKINLNLNQITMKFFFDTEFYEGKMTVKLLGFTIKEVNTIDLISIGIVSEHGKEYYAINKDCNLDVIWQDEWLRKNVLYTIWKDLYIDAFGANMPSFC